MPKRLKIFLLPIFLFPLLTAILFSRPFPKTIFRFDGTDIHTINQRRGFHSSRILGKLMENKLTFMVYRYQKNFFQGFDLNYYFFANHPRERVGIKETEKFSWLFLVPFLLGLYWQLRKKFVLGFAYYFIVLGIISLFESLDRFIFFVFPFFVFSIFLGFWTIFSTIYRQIRK
jgi:hypothetical protein